MRCKATLRFLLDSLLPPPANLVRVAMLCLKLLKAEHVSYYIGDLQLQSVDMAVTQLFCSRAELRSAWPELRAKCALQPVELLLQLLKALGVAGSIADGSRHAAVGCQAELDLLAASDRRPSSSRCTFTQSSSSLRSRVACLMPAPLLKLSGCC